MRKRVVICDRCYIQHNMENFKDNGWKRIKGEDFCQRCVDTGLAEQEIEKNRQYTLNTLRKGAGKLFQRMIRLEYASRHERVFCAKDGHIGRKVSPIGGLVCVTCGYAGPWNNGIWDAGHFIPRQKRATQFDETNVHPQCKYCNDHLKGNLANYALFMAAEYGDRAIPSLHEKAKAPNPFDKVALSELCVKWRKRVKEAERLLKENRENG